MESAPLVPSQKSFVSLVVSLVVCRCKRMNNNTRMTGKLTQLTNADASAQKENKKNNICAETFEKTKLKMVARCGPIGVGVTSVAKRTEKKK